MKQSARRLGHNVQHYVAKQSPGIARSTSVFLSHGQGTHIFDVNGNRYIDFTCGIGVTGLGHCHPALVKVVQNQATKIWHGQFTTGVTTALAEIIDEMTSILPPHLTNILFQNSGSEAVEATIRAARQFTKRPCVIAAQGGYHGRTMGALSITSSKYVYGAGCRPAMPGTYFCPVPYASQLHVPIDTPVEEMVRRSLAMLDDILAQQVSPHDVAMIILEPVLGEGGYFPLPASYLRGVRERCDKHGILLAMDEVQTGFGRCGGSFFVSVSQVGLRADVLIFGKGIANGLPLAGVAMTADVANGCASGTQGGTYAGSAIPCATGAEVVRILRDGGILKNAVDRGAQIRQGLEDITLRCTLPIMEIRGRGLMIGIQLHPTLPKGTASAVVKEAEKRGLLILSTSSLEVLRLIPPLNVTEEEVKKALNILEDSLVAALPIDTTVKGKAFESCCGSACYGGGGDQAPCRRYVR